MPKKPKTPPIRTSFPPPWRAEKTPSGYCIVAGNGRNVAYVYGEDEAVRRDTLKCPSQAEARSIANAISTLPDLIAKVERDC